ncbi:MAG: dihydroorotase [Bacillota bacterium]|nr:dihydroorotase [Bacillota bacterium]
MSIVLKNASVYIEGSFKSVDLAVIDGHISFISKETDIKDALSFDLKNCVIFPGLVDVHVHLREPGFLYKETIKTGTLAAASGGYTAICSMPNLNPVPDSKENIKAQLDAIKKDALINVYPYSAITKGEQGKEIVDIDELKDYAIAFSDDGRGVQSDEIMKKAMIKAGICGKIIAAHCEDNSLLNGGYIHDGEYARVNNHKGISSESEYMQIARDLKLAGETKCLYHVCHISTKESVDLIRQAKAKGLNVTCETAPHYLTLTDMDLKEDGRFKMNPPLRSEEDHAALIKGIQDGTIDMIATDHAPHSKEEKSKGLKDSLMGVTGLETAFPILYTRLVKNKIISLEKLISLMHDNPGKRFGIANPIREGDIANLTVFDLESEYKINPSEFNSKGKSTPFEGDEVYGKCLMTICNGNIVWKNL